MIDVLKFIGSLIILYFVGLIILPILVIAGLPLLIGTFYFKTTDVLFMNQLREYQYFLGKIYKHLKDEASKVTDKALPPSNQSDNDQDWWREHRKLFGDD